MENEREQTGSSGVVQDDIVVVARVLIARPDATTQQYTVARDEQTQEQYWDAEDDEDDEDEEDEDRS